MSFSFVHAADLHLDSPFEGITAQSERVAGALRSATFEAYDALIRLCIDREVDFLLLAGDVYDGADRSLRAQMRFHDGLKRLRQHGIRAFVVHGNHDPLDGRSASIRWDQVAHVYDGEAVGTEIVAVDGKPVAAVSGISYPTRDERRNLARMFQARHPELFQIALLHCNCGGKPGHEGYAPCSLEDLTGGGFDYWALGHVHTPSVEHERPYVVYPGNTQGRSIREPGERGCCLVTVHDGWVVDLERCPLDVVRWTSVPVSIQEKTSLDELIDDLSASLEQARQDADRRGVVCRVVLEGRGLLYSDLKVEKDFADLLDRLRNEGESQEPFVWVEKIENRCRPTIDLAQRREVRDLLGELLAISQGLRNGGELGESLQEVFADLHGHAVASEVPGLDDLSDEELEGILSDAEFLCADLLEAEQ